MCIPAHASCRVHCMQPQKATAGTACSSCSTYCCHATRAQHSTSSCSLPLPHAVLVQHVWPLLSPWERAQLRATCKELRGLADGLMDSTLQLEVTTELARAAKARTQVKAAPEQQDSAQPPPGTHAVADEWNGKCALLARCPRRNSLALRWMNAALKQPLCASAGQRNSCMTSHMQRLDGKAMSKALTMVSSLRPARCKLHVDMTLGIRSPSASIVPAFRCLPATLECLSFTIQHGVSEQFWSDLAGVLGSSTQLTRLHSLEVVFVDASAQVDVSPLAAIASSLTHLHLEWDHRMCKGVAGLSQVLAACGTSLTSLALPVYAITARQPSLSHILAAAPNLQQLDFLRDVHVPWAYGQSPTEAGMRALRAHTKLRRLVIWSVKLLSQLDAAALPPGSLQHLVMELHHCCGPAPEGLLQLLRISSLTQQCRLVCGSSFTLFRFPWHLSLDGGSVSNHLAQALSQSGMRFVRTSDAGGGSRQEADAAASTQLPGTCWLNVRGPLDQPSEQQAVTALLASLPGLHLEGWLLTIFCEEAKAVKMGSSDGLWLLPAVTHITTLSVNFWPLVGNIDCAAALSTALSHGYLQQLNHLVYNDMTDTAKQLVGLAEVLKTRPGIEISVPAAGALGVAVIGQLRAGLNTIPPPSRASPSGGCLGQGAGGAAAAGTSRGQQAAVTLDDEGRRLLLQRLLC